MFGGVNVQLGLTYFPAAAHLGGFALSHTHTHPPSADVHWCVSLIRPSASHPPPAGELEHGAAPSAPPPCWLDVVVGVLHRFRTRTYNGILGSHDLPLRLSPVAAVAPVLKSEDKGGGS